MMSLNNDDKTMWSAAYDEEFDGLKNHSAWTAITESQYNKIKHVVGRALPTMAILTIKYDED